MKVKKDSWLVRWAFPYQNSMPERVGICRLCRRAFLLFVLKIIIQAIRWLIVLPFGISIAFLMGFRFSKPRDKEYDRKTFVPIGWLPEVYGIPIVPAMPLSVFFTFLVFALCDRAALYESLKAMAVSENFLFTVYVVVGIIIAITAIILVALAFETIDGSVKWQQLKSNCRIKIRQIKEQAAKHLCPEVEIVD